MIQTASNRPHSARPPGQPIIVSQKSCLGNPTGQGFQRLVAKEQDETKEFGREEEKEV
jgi:hypothetical protein